MRRPRVNVSHALDAISRRALCEKYAYTSPGVELVVEFDLHDHAAALEALDRAVADVRGQIEETT